MAARTETKLSAMPISDLQEGKVDLLGPLLKNKATEEMFEFPKNSYGTVYTTLCALSSSSIRENSLFNVDLLRVGLWEVAEVRNEEVLTFLKSENLPYEITYYETAAEQFEALNNGSVDVISSMSLSPVANSRIVAQFAPRPYYFASTKGNTELIRKIDETIALIDLVDPSLQDTLYNTYFRTVNEAFRLTDEQKTALAAKGTLRVLCSENAAPYAYKLNGAPAGMLVSILNDFAEKTGLSLEYIFCEDREHARTLLSSGSYDILIGHSADLWSLFGTWLYQQRPSHKIRACVCAAPTKASGDTTNQTIALERVCRSRYPPRAMRTCCSAIIPKHA